MFRSDTELGFPGTVSGPLRGVPELLLHYNELGIPFPSLFLLGAELLGEGSLTLFLLLAKFDLHGVEHLLVLFIYLLFQGVDSLPKLCDLLRVYALNLEDLVWGLQFVRAIQNINLVIKLSDSIEMVRGS